MKGVKWNPSGGNENVPGEKRLLRSNAGVYGTSKSQVKFKGLRINGPRVTEFRYSYTFTRVSTLRNFGYAKVRYESSENVSRVKRPYGTLG